MTRLPGFSPTPYPEVNAVLAELLSALRRTLGDQFIGLYLYGSLAAGDFHPRRSDVDFLVVTRTQLPDDLLSRLEAMHAQLAASGLAFATRLEGVYIPIPLLARYDRESAVHPYLATGGTFYREAQQDSDWIIQRNTLREKAVIVAGPPIRPWIDPVQPEQLREAVLGFVRDWWAPMLASPERLRDREYQAYTVLTCCRILRTLRCGGIASKTESAAWAQTVLGPSWAALIDRALAWPDGPQPDEFEQALNLLRYVVEQASL